MRNETQSPVTQTDYKLNSDTSNHKAKNSSIMKKAQKLINSQADQYVYELDDQNYMQNFIKVNQANNTDSKKTKLNGDTGWESVLNYNNILEKELQLYKSATIK